MSTASFTAQLISGAPISTARCSPSNPSLKLPLVIFFTIASSEQFWLNIASPLTRQRERHAVLNDPTGHDMSFFPPFSLPASHNGCEQAVTIHFGGELRKPTRRTRIKA